MLLQEPVQAAIWDALNHYAYSDATFLAERLFAEVSSNEALYLLGTCYYRSGKPKLTYMLLQKSGCPTPQCKYLMAKCCMDVCKYSEVESVLAGNILTKAKSFDEIESEYGSLASHVFSLLGAMYSKTERPQRAAECHRKCLKLNPLLWTVYEKLCQLGEKVDPAIIFRVPNQTVQVNTTVYNNPLVKTTKINIQAPQPSFPLPMMTDVLSPIAEVPVTQSQGTDSKHLVPQQDSNSQLPVTPEGCQEYPGFKDIMLAPKSERKVPAPNVHVGRGLALKQALFQSPLSPSFGIFPLETPSPNVESQLTVPFMTPSPAFTDTTTLEIKEMKAPIKKPVTRRSHNQNQNQSPLPKPSVFSQSGNTRDINAQIGIQNNPPVRRSSRLFGNSNSSSVKENNKSQTGRKAKTKHSKSQQELNEINKGEIITDSKPVTNTETTQIQIAQLQQQSLNGILNLLQMLGKAFQALSQYECRKAIDLFSEIPQHQYSTAWVLCQLGRAYFELTEYQKAEKIFSEVRLNEPYHLEGMEYYSTALWHLQKEVELSALAQHLTEIDKRSPEAWCTTGNCFSLQKEHDIAIKFFQRAIQENPNFAYAYTLLGHEYVFTEELDKAMACFRNAIRVDPRHYNAWYGVGMIYYRQEKFSLAEVHFRKALLINPHSSALLCHIGVVQHAQQKSDHALVTLNKAIAADPRNPLCKFHRASILSANDRHKEALEELEELKQIIPKESLVYFLIGKVHKKLGNTHLALMNFSWAMDLDPKGVNNQIEEAIDKRYVAEEEDSLNRLSGTDDALEEVADVEDVQLQAIESDESL
ncbi:hypothetical protein CHS0354_031436 [Potamilus streckersoni]|uniref:Cell division cycle protein 27 homolog n=1 Tax=Potamilus streckersoni TaxID=2493646 RepID=A0AAE0SHR2_9BIVA|nr:hypothetical protein CHS0354_031436 [Potamilus streckersoni]